MLNGLQRPGSLRYRCTFAEYFAAVFQLITGWFCLFDTFAIPCFMVITIFYAFKLAIQTLHTISWTQYCDYALSNNLDLILQTRGSR